MTSTETETDRPEDDAPCCIAYVTSGRRDHVPGCDELAPPRPDPGAVFAKLVREVDAGRALVEQAGANSRRLAALDALALARDVLTDARDLFGCCACGQVDLLDAELGAVCVTAGLAHAPAACIRLDARTEL